MELKIEDIARRLVIGRKRDGRGVYDPGVKRELVEICQRCGVSVARVASRCGINANLLAGWIRQAHESAVHSGNRHAVAPPPAFVEVPMAPVVYEAAQAAVSAPPPMTVQVRLPNGVTLEVKRLDALQVASLIESLGRLPCSASTKG